MKELVIEAVRFAVSLEKSCYDFYRKAAQAAEDTKGREIFEQLARQEGQHLEAMRGDAFDCCCEPQPHYSEEGFVADPGGTRGRVLEQLRLSLLNKQSAVNLYLALSRCFKEPSVSRVFQMALLVARQELSLIRQHYLNADPPPSPALIRRPRRAHAIGAPQLLQPNKHSQLYFSLLDSGRQNHLW